MIIFAHKLSHGMRNIYRSKLYQQHAHLGKSFLLPLLSKVCETFLSIQSKKTCGIIWPLGAFFAFLEKRRPNKYC